MLGERSQGRPRRTSVTGEVLGFPSLQLGTGKTAGCPGVRLVGKSCLSVCSSAQRRRGASRAINRRAAPAGSRATGPSCKLGYARTRPRVMNLLDWWLTHCRASAQLAMQNHVLATVGMPVCLSVRPSHTSIVSKRRELGSRNLHSVLAADRRPCQVDEGS